LEVLVQKIEGITERQQATESVLATVIKRVERLERPELATDAPADDDDVA
jgi:hypothetical protein